MSYVTYAGESRALSKRSAGFTGDGQKTDAGRIARQAMLPTSLHSQGVPLMANGKGHKVKLRKRIANSPRLNRAAAKLFATYIRLIWHTTRWQINGMDELRAHLATGQPLIAALWHQRLLMSPYLFPRDAGPICSLTSEARGGRFAGQVQREFGFDTIAMAKSKRHVALSRDVVRKMAGGTSIGIAVDGPNGPARQAQTVPLLWARMSGQPIFLVTYSVRRHWLLGSWDRAMLPWPFTRGVILCQRLDFTVPRKADAEQMETLRLKLQQELDALTAKADLAVGHKVACE